MKTFTLMFQGKGVGGEIWDHIRTPRPQISVEGWRLVIQKIVWVYHTKLHESPQVLHMASSHMYVVAHFKRKAYRYPVDGEYNIFSLCSHYYHRVENTSLPNIMTNFFSLFFNNSNILAMFYFEYSVNYSVRVPQNRTDGGSAFFRLHCCEEDYFIHTCIRSEILIFNFHRPLV